MYNDRTSSLKYIVPDTAQMALAMYNGRAMQITLETRAIIVYLDSAAGEMVSPGLTVPTLRHLSRTLCRFLDSWYWFTPERKIRSCRATLETGIECQPVDSRLLAGRASKFFEM